MTEQSATDEAIVVRVLERLKANSEESRKKQIYHKLIVWMFCGVVVGCLGLLINAVLMLAVDKFDWPKAFPPTDVFLLAAIIPAATLGDLLMAKLPDESAPYRVGLVITCFVISALGSVMYWFFKNPSAGSVNGWVVFSICGAALVCSALSIGFAAGR